MTSLSFLTILILPFVHSEPPAHRLYDGITAFINNPDGQAFKIDLEVRDINFRMQGPSELLVKAYSPDGKPAVREIVPDDGVIDRSSDAHGAGWDHEAWYYATVYSRGLRPLIRWSAFSMPSRLAHMPKRSFSWEVKGGQKGVYKILLVGNPDLYTTLKIDPPLKYGLAGSPEWIHGHHDLFKRTFVYVPKSTSHMNVHFLQFDEPASRSFVLKDAGGTELATGSGANGLVQEVVHDAGRFADQILTLEVSAGSGDYLLNVTHQLENDFKPVRAKFQAVTGVLAPDKETARAVRGGAIYHDEKVFWQQGQVRLYDWLKKFDDEDFDYPAELDKAAGFVSVGSHNSPKARSADRIMHAWPKHKNPQALNAAVKDMLFGLRLIGHGDHVAIGPNRNLAYEMGCYTFFWYRPAWRIIHQSNAPQEVKDVLREFTILCGDRLAFCRTVSCGNGNAFGSLMAGVRYCVEAAQDPMLTSTFDTIWERFISGGYGERVGIGPSGGLQESMAYDYHYGSYVLRGWRAINQDLKDPRMIKAYNRILNLFSYLYFRGSAGNPYSSRTSHTKTAGGYNAWDSKFRWKGFGGPDFLKGVNGHNEWFAARRPTFYMLTYHGRLTPTWEGEGFHGQIGLGGGAICQIEVIGKGQVISSKPNGSYGSGMHLSQWPGFHVHGIVGYTSDGKPLVAANSEHFNARIEGNTVISTGPVRQSSVNVERRYTYGPSSIICEASLSGSERDNVFSLWGGRPSQRGKISEAWEMIPFADVLKRKGKRSQRNRTKVTLLGADGSDLAVLDDSSVGKDPIVCAGVRIEVKDYGAVISLDEVRKVKRGKNDTILVYLGGGNIPASQATVRYVIVPFIGEAPQLGDVDGGKRKGLPASRIELPADLAAVPAALADVPAHEIKDRAKLMASVRFAIAGDQMVVHASVREPKIVHHDTVWKGSDLEVFGAMPDKFEIGQVFLVPADDRKKAGAYVPFKTTPKATAAVQTASKTIEGGYEISAIIPLELLKIPADAKQFLIEFQVSQGSAKARAYKTLFGSKYAYENCSKYALFGFEEE